MRVLVVAATAAEIGPFLAGVGEGSDAGPRTTTRTFARGQLDALITGVGMVATAAWCARALAQQRYDLALNFGVCGSFDPALGPPTVVHVRSDRIAELGAEDGEEFVTAQELELLKQDEFPFTAGRLVNASPPPSAALSGLPSVDAITVNTVHGDAKSVADISRRFHPQVESMEGAAFMYACLIQRVAFAQVRAVSNIVERRNRAAWKLPDAIRRLTDVAMDIVGAL
jgi:futalosine hydrolase